MLEWVQRNTQQGARRPQCHVLTKFDEATLALARQVLGSGAPQSLTQALENWK